MARVHVTLREPIQVRVEAEQEKDARPFLAEMVAVLVEEALDARDKKAARK